MVSIAKNKFLWAQNYGWKDAGDEWSAAWGSVQMQWHGTLLPRIHRFLPAKSVLEIACGFGRWTQFLKLDCERYVGVDLSPRCIEACKQRFPGDEATSFFLNDGKSLDMVADDSVDFIFSFDSLVHADTEALFGYLGQFRRILKRNGAAFIHHSNNGATWRFNPRRVPKLRGVLTLLHLTEYHHIRDFSVSAATVEKAAQGFGLACIGQEINTWLNRRTLIDCFSTFTRLDSDLARPNKVVRSYDLPNEARSWAKLSGLYS